MEIDREIFSTVILSLPLIQEGQLSVSGERMCTIPHQGRQHSFVEIDREIFSTVILSLPLIQEGQLSVSGERMCTIQVNHFED